MFHLQHEVKQLQPVAVSLQVLCYVEIQDTQWLSLYVHTLLVLRRKHNLIQLITSLDTHTQAALWAGRSQMRRIK